MHVRFALRWPPRRGRRRRKELRRARHRLLLPHKDLGRRPLPVAETALDEAVPVHGKEPAGEEAP